MLCVGMDGLGLLERQSSIENEPRTLNIRQIEFAREAALSVMNTRSIEEALSIFTEGLEPVVRRAKGSGECDGRLIDGGNGGEGQKWNDDERIGIAGIRDIVSAPF